MLEKEELELILNEWNFWDNNFPIVIPRSILDQPFKLHHDLALIIQGVRRSGKSTLMQLIMSKLKLDPKSCLFVNFEDPRLVSSLDFRFLDQLVEWMILKFPKKKKYYFFFDEIQNVELWQKWLHLKLEKSKNHYFIITGSNSTLLSGKMGSVLTGRHLTTELYPFDFYEYKKMWVNHNLEDYLLRGGFPRAIKMEQPGELLREYFIDIIERDVRKIVPHAKTQTLFQLVKIVYESLGSEFSQRSIAKLLGISVDTAGDYLDACESAYLIMKCPYFSFSERQRNARNRKYYPVDLGLRNSVVTKTGRDLGKSLETIVFHHLRKRHPLVSYWKQKHEVDFVIQDKSGIIPIQVSWGEMEQRHQDGFMEFKKEYPFAKDLKCICRNNVEDFLKEEI